MKKDRSLGTNAMVARADANESYSSDSVHLLAPPRPPPPAALNRNVRQAPLPPLPPLPPSSPVGLGLLSPLPRQKPKRKTVLGRLEGWWDLNLLEKRQTLFGKHA